MTQRRVRKQERVRKEPPKLTQTVYEDERGRKWQVLVPIGHEAEASRGIVLGPPDVSDLGLPDELALVLHQQLFNRGLITKRDLRGRGMEVVAALQAAYRVDAGRIMNLYKEATNGK